MALYVLDIDNRAQPTRPSPQTLGTLRLGPMVQLPEVKRIHDLVDHGILDLL